METSHDHKERIFRAFAMLEAALTPYVEAAMQAVYGDAWRQEAQHGLRYPYLSPKAWDVHALLLILRNQWQAAFHDRLGEAGRVLVNELLTRREQDMPQYDSAADTYRVLDTVGRLLRAVGDEAGARAIHREALAVIQLQFQQQSPPSTQPAKAAPGPPEKQEPAAPAPEAGSTAPPVSGEGAIDLEDTRAIEPYLARPEDEDEPDDAGADNEEPEALDDEKEAGEENQESEEDAEATGGFRNLFGRLFQKSDERTLEPLELRTRLLDKIEASLKRFRSARPLPFNRITTHILAPASSDRLTYEAAINTLSPPFDQAVLHRLHDAGFDVPGDLRIKTSIHSRPPQHLAAVFEEAGTIYVDLKQQTARTTATITVVKGVAEKPRYRIRSNERVNIGRLREVLEDRYGHVIRRNDIAFVDHNAATLEGENRDVNETVSRRHARIEFDARAGLFVLINEQGATSVSRRSFPQPVRVAHQAVPLQDGDLIYLGRACLRFETKRR